MKLTNTSVKKLRKDFPILNKIVYLDNASTSQKPKQVLKSFTQFYEKSNANAGRGIYKIAQESTKKYEEARKVVADSINAGSNEIIFTKNTTESVNLLAYTLHETFPKERNEIVLTEMEHHSNLVPWQQMAKSLGLKLKFIKVRPDFTLDMEDAKQKITYNTAIVSLVHISNSLGTINPVEQIIKMAKEKGAITVVDAAQSVPHMKIDVKKMNCDFLAFSGHKMLAPNGIGVLYGRKERLSRMPVFMMGGGMIRHVSPERTEFADIPYKFEAGTQNVAGAIALAESIKYLEKIGMKNIEDWVRTLTKYAFEQLMEIEGLRIYTLGPNVSGIISITFKNIPPHDLASLLDDYNICIRGGHLCTMPLMKRFFISGTSRISFYFYNTKEDVDKLIKAIKGIVKKVK